MATNKASFGSSAARLDAVHCPRVLGGRHAACTRTRPHEELQMSTNTFATIDLGELVTVTGGLEVEGEGSVNIGVGSGQVNLKGKYKRSNYESCAAAVTGRPGWTPGELKDACGLPPAS